MPRRKRSATETESPTEEVSQPSKPSESPQTIYQFTAKLITGKEVSLEIYKGCVCIIVNVASKCGFTNVNYKQLVELHEKFAGDQGLKILAFPCNQFGCQEPGNAEKIRKFVKSKNVKFDVFDRVKVNGKDAHPLWNFLKEKLPGPKGKDIKWNFTKFIIDQNGIPVERHRSNVKPLDLTGTLVKMWLTEERNNAKKRKLE